MYASLVAGHYRCDMVLHPLLEHLWSHIIALGVIDKPFCQLRMPHQTVADDEHAVCLAKFHELVGKSEVVDILFRMDFLRLHAVFSHNGVVMLLQYFQAGFVASLDLIAVEGGSDQEIILECVLESGLNASASGQCHKSGDIY